MRNFYYILYCMLISFALKAQNYTPMLDNHNEWQVISCFLDDCFKDTYYTDGDTIVNGKQHKILDGFHYISRSFLLREELDTKKVFLTTNIDNQLDEYLLYDFSMQVGDSIRMNNPITPFPQDGGYYKLDSIVQKPVWENNLRNFYYFTASPSNDSELIFKPIWVEGVGSLAIVTAPGGTPSYFGAGQLSCFFKNGELFYFDGAMQDSCDSLFLTQDPSSTNEILFYTQHQRGMIQSQIPIEIIEIFRITGEFIRKESGKNQLKAELNLNTLQKGTYVLRIKTTNNQFKSIKFIFR